MERLESLGSVCFQFFRLPFSIYVVQASAAQRTVVPLALLWLQCNCYFQRSATPRTRVVAHQLDSCPQWLRGWKPRNKQQECWQINHSSMRIQEGSSTVFLSASLKRMLHNMSCRAVGLYSKNGQGLSKETTLFFRNNLSPKPPACWLHLFCLHWISRDSYTTATTATAMDFQSGPRLSLVLPSLQCLQALVFPPGSQFICGILDDWKICPNKKCESVPTATHIGSYRYTCTYIYASVC